MEWESGHVEDQLDYLSSQLCGTQGDKAFRAMAYISFPNGDKPTL